MLKLVYESQKAVSKNFRLLVLSVPVSGTTNISNWYYQYR